MLVLRLPGGRAITVTPAPRMSSPVSCSAALPPANSRGERRPEMLVDPLESLPKADPGLAIDLLNCRVQGCERLLEVGMLRIEVSLALGLLLVLVDRSEVDRPEPRNPTRNRFELRGPVVGIGLGSEAIEQLVEPLAGGIHALPDRPAENERLLALDAETLQRLALPLYRRRLAQTGPRRFGA